MDIQSAFSSDFRIHARRTRLITLTTGVWWQCTLSQLCQLMFSVANRNISSLLSWEFGSTLQVLTMATFWNITGSCLDIAESLPSGFFTTMLFVHGKPGSLLYYGSPVDLGVERACSPRMQSSTFEASLQCLEYLEHMLHRSSHMHSATSRMRARNLR